MSNPPTVAGSVTFYVAHSGGEDYQVARPVMNLAPGFQSRYAQSDIGTVFVPEDENLLVPSHTTRDVTAQTTGEYFKSLRALVKRYGWFAELSQQENYIGLRTRHMTEDPVSGERTISRTNFSDKVLPTPWYMASFLYRFYNGSSQLKVIPYTANVVADSYLSFDESSVDQLDVAVQESYGQPIFQQHQQVSNAFEVRTPYYRGIRCDVVGSNQTPVLGDVRTNIRCRNRVSTRAQTSSLFESAGDDFNYFFMVGPPPMSDIRNVRALSTFPTGNEVTLDLSGITSVNEMDDFASFIDVSFSPDIAITVNGKIAVSSVESVPLVTNEQGTILVPVLSCTIFKTGPTTGGIRVPLAETPLLLEPQPQLQLLVPSQLLQMPLWHKSPKPEAFLKNVDRSW